MIGTYIGVKAALKHDRKEQEKKARKEQLRKSNQESGLRRQLKLDAKNMYPDSVTNQEELVVRLLNIIELRNAEAVSDIFRIKSAFDYNMNLRKEVFTTKGFWDKIVPEAGEKSAEILARYDTVVIE